MSSHSCRSAYCSHCRPGRARPAGDGLIAFDLTAIAACALIAGIAWIVMAPLRIWHVTGADGKMHPDTATWIAYGISGTVIMASLMFFSIRAAGKRETVTRVPPAMPLPRRKTRPACYCDSCMAGAPCAAPVPVPPFLPPPACRHLHAVKVDSMFGETVAYWCPQCETQLDAEFGLMRRFCCGTEPGEPHWPSCPQATVRP